ncbi:hypothetical protein RSAG8_07126, partial [Rhizoctonia solani AG-8 WAC10335]
MSTQAFSLQTDGPAHSIAAPVGTDGNIQVISFFAPVKNAADYTRVEFYDDIGNVLLHLSFRPKQGFVAINAKEAGGSFDGKNEIRVDFAQHLPPSKVAQFRVTDTGPDYQISFSDGPGVEFHKLREIAQNKVSSVAYLHGDGLSVLSNPLNVHTFTA